MRPTSIFSSILEYFGAETYLRDMRPPKKWWQSRWAHFSVGVYVFFQALLVLFTV